MGDINSRAIEKADNSIILDLNLHFLFCGVFLIFSGSQYLWYDLQKSFLAFISPSPQLTWDRKARGLDLANCPPSVQIKLYLVKQFLLRTSLPCTGQNKNRATLGGFQNGYFPPPLPEAPGFSLVFIVRTWWGLLAIIVMKVWDSPIRLSTLEYLTQAAPGWASSNYQLQLQSF